MNSNKGSFSLKKVIVNDKLNMLTKEARFDVAKHGLFAYQLWLDLNAKRSSFVDTE
jgi:hypothetical protein